MMLKARTASLREGGMGESDPPDSGAILPTHPRSACLNLCNGPYEVRGLPVGEDVRPERPEVRRRRVAEVRESEQVLDAAQQRVVVVAGGVEAARLDERLDHDRARVAAPGAGDP